MNFALDSRDGTALQFSAGSAVGERFAAARAAWRRLGLVGDVAVACGFKSQQHHRAGLS
jgi:hypothetical protein